MDDSFIPRMSASDARLNLALCIKGIMYPEQISYDTARTIKAICECYLAACDEYAKESEERESLTSTLGYKPYDTPTNLYHD